MKLSQLAVFLLFLATCMVNCQNNDGFSVVRDAITIKENDHSVNVDKNGFDASNEKGSITIGKDGIHVDRKDEESSGAKSVQMTSGYVVVAMVACLLIM